MTAQGSEAGADRTAVAEAAARAGAAVAGDRFRDDIDVEQKNGKTDVVTEADRAGQRAVIERIREDFPDDAIVGEEEDELKAVPDAGAAWVIDPIDGTNNYVRDIRAFATAVAAVVDGEPVAAANVLPAMDDVYVADADGTSRNGTRVTVSDRTDPETAAVTPTVWWDFDARDEYARACAEIVERFGDMRRFGSAQFELGLCAAGAVEAIFCIKAVTDGMVPPTLNLDEPSDGCHGMNLVAHTAQERKVRYALSNSFGFGGTNASLIVSAFSG